MEMPMIPKPEQARWALQEAAIRAEINQAKANVDLLRMANASQGWTNYIQKWRRQESAPR
jgi:hypothetical protein